MRATHYPRERSIQSLFKDWARATPDAIAVLAPEGEISYGALDARSDELAFRLREAGVEPGDLVALCAERSIEMVGGLLAILKAGAGEVPLDPAHPPERHRFQLEDTRASVVLAQERLASPLLEGLVQDQLHPVRLVALDGAASRQVDEGAEPFAAPPVPATAIAYVIYTSGSTGRPKGVVVTHRAVLRLVLGTDYIDVQPGDRQAQLANAAFDAVIYEVWAPLLNGGTVVILPREVVLRPAALAAEIHRLRLTSMFLTTALFNQMAREAPGAFAPMREVLFGGEACDPKIVRQVLADRPPRRLLHVYGPTENTTFSTWHEVRSVAEGAVTVPIGGPIAHGHFYVLGPDFTPVAEGEAGLLYVAGDGLAQGYLRRPDLTAERFLPDPYAPEPGGRIYDTGDLVRLLAGGNVEFVGRADQQVKIRGFRIELGEIESALLGVEGIGEAAVLARSASGGGKRLVAYLAGSEREIDPSRLRATLGSRLPDYMVPSAFVWLPALPLNPNGKVDRQALARIEPETKAGDDFVAPRTPLEAELSAIWNAVLELPESQETGVTADFFALGGHSLLAGRLVAAIERQLGVTLPASAVFEDPTIERLAARIEGEGAAVAAKSDAEAKEREVGEAAPLSPAQRRLWFLDRLEPGSAAYNLAFSFRFSGPLEPHFLAATLTEIERRHEVLRTTFAIPEGALEPVQVVSSPRPVNLAFVDLSGEEPAKRSAEADRLAAAEARRPFDLESGPLVRWTLLRQEPGEHRLLATFHHTVFDGTSLEPFRRELRSIYGALAGGDSSPLPEPRAQYADFAHRQEGWLRTGDLERQLAYWRDDLVGHETVELAGDRPRPAKRSDRGAVFRSDLPAELGVEIEAFARQRRTTPFMTLLAAFLATLQRYTGQDDLLVGTPVAGRGEAGTEGLLGFFVNTLPLRVDLGGEPSFEELLERVRAAALGAFAHQDVPFERLVAEVSPERDLSRNPLFQILFAYLDGWEEEARIADGLTLGEAEEVHAGTARFDLSFHLHRKPRGLELWLEYSTALFDERTIERLGAHFESVLRGALQRPGAGLASLPLLDAAELAELAALDRASMRRHPTGLLHELFAAQALRQPGAVALVAGEEVLTYAELEERSASLARSLSALGAGPEVGIAVQLERRAELIVALLAVLRSGSFYVPIDPRYPKERRAYLVEDSGARIGITGEGVAAIEGGAPAIGGRTGPSPSNLAYLIYTSGSTGKPKAVAIPHGSAVQMVHWARELFSPEELRCVLACTAVTFDLSVFEIFVTLAAGGAVVLVEDALALLTGPPSLPEGLALTLVNTVPSAMAELLRSGALPPSVGTINLAGEALTRALADRVYERPETRRLYNLYGPSEDTTYSTLALIERSAERPPAIGRPVDGTRGYVLESQLSRLPFGVPGELFLAGLGLARGYLGRPDLTAERFLPDPFGGEPGGRMYRTGDLTRLRPDGELEYLGRLDHQVKIRGHRIELGEVETTLVRQPGVEAAVVVARAGAGGEPRLVAYVAGDGLTAPELRRALQRELTGAMIPSAFVFLAALPLTAHGKVDRRALPAPEEEEIEPESGERDPVEELLAGIWAELLGLSRIPSHQSFFEIGGHSLVATRMTSRVRAVLGVEVPLRVLFEAPTLAGFAARVREARDGGTTLPLPPITRVPRGEPLPASFSQRRLWFVDRLAPGGTAYNHTVAVRLAGPLDVAALDGAFTGLALRHEALRTVFVERSGEPWQVIQEPSPWFLPVVDLGALPAGSSEKEAFRLAKEMDRRPFDLARGPLLRSALLRLEESTHDLLIGLHHIVSDAWSMSNLARDLGELYRGLKGGTPPRLPELPVQYADFATWQRSVLSGELLDEQLEWWLRLLSGAPRLLEIPLDRPRPAIQSFRGHRIRFDLPAELATRLEESTRSLGVTPFMATLAAFSVLLSRYSGQEDLVVGTPIANRGRAELEDLVGFFVGTLALRLDLRGAPTFAEVARRIREVSLGAFARQDVPFELLVDELRPERSLSHSPVFQTTLAFQSSPPMELGFDGLASTPLDLDEDRAPFDLSLFLSPLPDGSLAAELYAASDLFDPATSRRMLGHYRNLLAAVCDRGAQTLIGDLNLLSPHERAQLAREWSDTEVEQPEKATIHALFREHARRHPEAVALLAGEEIVTYGELDSRSDRVAIHLRAAGVGPDVTVGIAAGRSPHLIAGLLGILKAGGAYVPLDPDYPRERLAVMLEDSGVRVLLVQDGFTSSLPDSDIPRLSLERIAGEAGAEGVVPPDEVGPGHLAYVIFTSGSTGRPKGVAVSHRGVVRLVHQTAYCPLDEEETFLQLAPVAFDASTFEIWAPLLNGGRLALFPSGPIDLGRLAREVETRKVTTLFLTAGLFHQVVDTRIELLRPVSRLFSGGDFLTPARVRRVVEELPEVAMLHVYGPTEVTTYTTFLHVRPGFQAGATIPIGRPIDNTRVALLDRALEPVPIGVVGEIYAGGAGLARGYLGRPDLTAERFLPDPVGGGAGERLYATGDLGRWLPSGSIELLGRRDAQVKVRGFRIELGEIEKTLAAHPEVESCVVAARADASGDKRLVAYVVPRSGPGVGSDTLRLHLEGMLPGYMVPATYVELPSLPLDPNGKIDRRALPEPSAPARKSSTPPRTPLEEGVAAIWGETLGVQNVGVEDSFWELGGHSLLATLVLTRVEEELGIEVPLQTLFTSPRLADFASALADLMMASQGSEELDEALAELEGLSEEEVRALLEQSARELEELQ